MSDPKTDIDPDIGEAFDEALKKEGYPVAAGGGFKTSSPIPMRETLAAVRPAPVPPTLLDQVAQFERIERGVADRIRRERLFIESEHDRLWTETQNAHAARISEETAKLEKARDDELLSLKQATSRKLHELEQLVRRLG